MAQQSVSFAAQGVVPGKVCSAKEQHSILPAIYEGKQVVVKLLKNDEDSMETRILEELGGKCHLAPFKNLFHRWYVLH